MSYKNDSYLVIMNKLGSASSDAKVHMFETYDRIRDLTVSGSNAAGTGFGTAGGFLWQLARMISPGSFMTTLGGNTTMNIPGTSYWSPYTGGTAEQDGGTAAFGIGNLGNYPGFPGGAAPIQWGYGSDYDLTGLAVDITGAASGLSSSTDLANMAGLTTAAYGIGTATGSGIFSNNWVIPTAGVISGISGIMQAAAPYMGAFGLGATVAGNLLQGTSSAALAAYQNITGRIQNNADIIMSNKVKNIETVVKMLDTQGDVLKKMLKDSLEGDKKNIDSM